MFRPFGLVKTRILRRLHHPRLRNYHQTDKKGSSTYGKLNKSRSLFLVSAGSIVAYVGGSLVFGGEKFYREYAMPFVHALLDGEDAHRLAVLMAKWNVVPIDLRKAEYPALETEVFGLRFKTPVGLAAGFDKDGEAVAGLHNVGFAFVEVGSITPLPQEGNPKPRVFRLPEDEAVINRYGFNSAGHDVVHRRLLHFRRSSAARSSPPPPPPPPHNAKTTSFTRNSLPEVVVRDVVYSSPPGVDSSAILGVNLGQNKTSSDPIGDYVSGVEKFADLADYLVVNVSSPNTPGLRDMQAKAALEALLDAVLDKLKSLPEKESPRPPLLIKIAPDLADGDVDDVVRVLLERSGPNGVAGVIVSNTTISRPPSLQHRDTAKETGGLSGQPLKDLSTHMIKRVYEASGGKIPIIGCGGVSTGADAYEKIRAGASLVQIYSSLVFGGPPVVKAIARELNELLAKDGFASVEQAVGVASLENVDLKALRDFMEDTVLEKFARERAREAAREGTVEEARGDDDDDDDVKPSVTSTASDPTEEEEEVVVEEEQREPLRARYSDVPASHSKTPNSSGIPST